MLMLVAEECLVVDDVLVVMLDVIQSQPAIVHRERGNVSNVRSLLI